METISSRQNKYIKHLKALSADRAYRGLHGEYICAGEKLLVDAVNCGAEIVSVLWSGKADVEFGRDVLQYIAPPELVKYTSPLKDMTGPLFTVRIPETAKAGEIADAIVLDHVQDPGNVGTIIRTANAFGIDAVFLVNRCADPYNPKTVRSTMGALFRQRVLEIEAREAVDILRDCGIALYGASLSESAGDIREIDLHGAAVVVGNEGRGISPELLEICDGTLKIPMEGSVQSLNAAVSAAVIMWEMTR